MEGSPMTINTLVPLSDDLSVVLTLDDDRHDFYVTLPSRGLTESAHAVALADALRAYGLEAMTAEECPWDFVDDGMRVYCAEVA
jgi:hypothetical protein